MFTSLLRPIKERVLSSGMVLPSAKYVGVENKSSNRSTDGMYEIDMKKEIFPTFVKDVLMQNELELKMNEMNERNSAEIEEIEEIEEIGRIMAELNDRNNNTYDNYDDAVKEEIGRILLDYYQLIVVEKQIQMWQGGGTKNKTRKRSRRHRRFNAKTRSHVRNELRKRITRLNRGKGNGKHKHKHKRTRRH
jgi:hypothetical protein